MCDSKYTKRYNSPFSLTNFGEKVGKEIITRINSVLDEIGTCMNNQERIMFYNLLSKISDKLDNISNEYQ